MAELEEVYKLAIVLDRKAGLKTVVGYGWV